jgi:hypothetical protein
MGAAVDVATATAYADGRDLARAAARRLVRAAVENHLPDWRRIAHRRALRAARRMMREKIAALGG